MPRAGCRPSYNEVITVSALADTDGKPGALGGHRCFSWGSYDSDDTYANFSNYGSDIDIIAPGKCIWSTKPGSTYGYSSGTSMATPAVTGAAALYKASRPMATPAEVREALQYLGNLNWKTSTDPDSYHEKLLDVSKLGVLGTFSLNAPTVGVVPESGGAASIPITINRSSTFFERVRLYVSGDPCGLDGKPGPRKRVRLVGEVGAAQRDCTRLGFGRHVRDHREGPEPGTHQHGRRDGDRRQGPADCARPDLRPGEDERRPERQLRARGRHVARGQRPVELDLGLREPVES